MVYLSLLSYYCCCCCCCFCSCFLGYFNTLIFRYASLNTVLLKLPTFYSYDFGRGIFDALFGVKFDKTFPRVVRDATTTCGQGLYPANDHAGAVGQNEQDLWGDGADFLVIMSDECNLQCQKKPQQAYKKSSYSKASTKKSGNSAPDNKPSTPQAKYISVPLTGWLQLTLN